MRRDVGPKREKRNLVEYLDPGLVQSLALMDPQFTAHTNRLQLELSSLGSDSSVSVCVFFLSLGH